MSESANDTEAVVTAFVQAFAKTDHGRMASLLDDDLVSYVTTADGGTTVLRGRDAYLNAVRAVDYASASLDIAITQSLMVKPGQVLIMVEVKAARKGRDLHNFAAFLIDVTDGRIREMRMVEAQPAYSDAFWKG